MSFALTTSQPSFEMLALVIWAIIGVVIGAVLSVMIFGWSKETVPRAIALSIVGAAIVLNFRGNWVVRNDIDVMRTNFDKIEWTSDCLASPQHFDNRVFDVIANSFYSGCRAKCGQIAKNEIELTPEQVKDTWLMMLENAEKTFYATNTIAPDDWPALACEKQRDAKVDTISRVMILRREEPDFNEVLTQLGRRQLRECKVDQMFGYMKHDLYTNFSSPIATLGHVDIVLVDSSVVLITAYDERDKTIRKGWVTTSADKVEAARKLFAELFRTAAPIRL